jgi:hypothetical protein
MPKVERRVARKKPGLRAVPKVYKLADGGLVVCPTTGAKNVEAIGDHGLPPYIHYQHPGDGKHPGREIGIEVVDGVPWVTYVALLGEPGARRVKVTDMTAVAGQLEELVESALAAASCTKWKLRKIGDDRVIEGWSPVRRPAGVPNEAKEARALPEIRRARKRANRKVTGELLQQVADVYSKGHPAPTEAVRRVFEVSQRTAARYVQQARDARLLPSTTQGKASK